ncbi:putative S-protein1 [Cardamine amara subsp. amara]|uniref:S-protein homolog n=1 Tax=Cardamine amara subsp. amara TaxID=228776 RepID=A0ABD1A649_CARAN
MKTISIFLVVFAFCMISNAYGIKNPFKGKKTTLLFRNGLAHKNWLKVRCKSGDNDVRERYMKPAEDWGFSFHDDVFGETLFWCTLYKGPTYKVHKKFDAYVQDKRMPHGGSYNYIAKEDGIYHSNFVQFKLRKMYDWVY